MGIVVAIDFGTSRTAYAWTQEGIEDQDIEVGVPEGSGHLSVHDAKTPTNVLLEHNASRVVAFGYAAEDRYIKEAEEEDSRPPMFFRWFKMLLHKSGSDDPMVAAESGRRVRLSLVLAKALEFVKDGVVARLKSKGMRPHAKDIVWVVTVPAIWNDWAKSMMRNAAYDAGMIGERQSTRLKLALEPECACISTQMEPGQGFLSDIGKKLLIVDCGGGTVDITAHEVVDKKPLRLKELMVPDGGPLGATRVDEQFFFFFRDLVGFELFDELKRKPAYLSLTRAWEEKKVAFTGTENEDDGSWWANLSIGDVMLEMEIKKDGLARMVSEWNDGHPGKPAKARGKTGLALSFALLKSFFDGPVRKVVEKTRDVIRSHRLTGLDYLVLAGGFGRSPLLQAALRRSFEADGVRVVVSSHPDLVIVKGAAVFGARSSLFESRKAKYTYGVDACRIYDPFDPYHRRHERRRRMCNDGEWRLDVFSVHGRMGDDIDVGTKTPRRAYKPITESQDTMIFKVLVSRDREVFMEDEPGVQTLCSCTVDVDMSVPFAERRYEVEFAFGDTETHCWIFLADQAVHKMLVEFPSDVHWL